MNKCANCKVNVYPQHSKCPLCGKFLGATEQSETSYPKYNILQSKGELTTKKILLFLTIISCSILIFINIFTWNNSMNFWSIIVSACLVSLWTIVQTLFSKKNSIGTKVLSIYAALSVLLIVIDVCSGFYKWSTTYVVPFMTMTVTIIFTFCALGGKKRFKEYLGYLIAIFFISFCPIITFVFSLSMQGWSSLVAMFYCWLTTVGFLIFSGNNLKREIKKRFHF
ncbi:MAG: DUF6320 domain-containing protein [Oscillospiraceae bacterium]